jgi:hypothetical protein
MKLLPWVSVTLSILSYFWIGFNRERREVIERFRVETSAWKRAWIVVSFLLPYVIGAGAVIYLFIASLLPLPMKIRHQDHVVREVQGCEGDPVKRPLPQTGSRTGAPITCPNEHFSFSVSGQFSGHSHDQLRERFGTIEVVQVYVLVEEYRPWTLEQLWLQIHGGANLDSLGQYKIKGYLGGTANNTALEGESFSIRIFIPGRDAMFKPPLANYHLTDLPKHLFLSPAYDITTHGPQGRPRPPSKKQP